MQKQRTEYHIQKSEVLPYTPEQLYSLVADIGRYPEFIPWCKKSRVKECDKGVIAELVIGYGPVRTSFTTRNRNQPGKEIRVELLEGPFEHLEGAWHFRSEKDEKTRITMELRFKFSEHRLGILFASLFKKGVARILDAFKKRARALYGGAPETVRTLN